MQNVINRKMGTNVEINVFDMTLYFLFSRSDSNNYIILVFHCFSMTIVIICLL